MSGYREQLGVRCIIVTYELPDAGVAIVFGFGFGFGFGVGVGVNSGVP